MKALFPLLSGTLLLVAACEKDKSLDTSCSDEGFVQNIADPAIIVAVPNVVTVNNDGKNDVFKAYVSYKNPPAGSPTPTFTVQRLTVTKLGTTQILYSGSGAGAQFDGHDNQGAELPEGKYHYELTLDNNSVQGTLRLTRTTTVCSCRTIDLTDPLVAGSCP